MRSQISAVVIGSMLLVRPTSGFSWGDEGHEIIALVAEHYLSPQVRAKAASLLAGDASALTPTTGIADEATWADRFRDVDRDTTQAHYRQTRNWHFINIELDGPDVRAACYQFPALPPGTRASAGPAADCIVDKIEEFRRELGGATTGLEERRLALQFLLHLVGDLHQPLHAADNHDRGGNDVRVKAAMSSAGTLHHYWDTVFVKRLGTLPEDAARQLIAGISAKERSSWSSGSPADWAMQSFEIAKNHAYGRLPRSGVSAGPLHLDARYEADAEMIVTMQLQRASVRLAWILNETLR